MPNFDSLKSNSITTDLVGLLKKILRLAPDAAYDSQCIKTDQLVKFLEFPARREEIGSNWLDAETNESTVSDIHYLMGDYFMKNGDRIRIGFEILIEFRLLRQLPFYYRSTSGLIKSSKVHSNNIWSISRWIRLDLTHGHLLHFARLLILMTSCDHLTILNRESTIANYRVRSLLSTRRFHWRKMEKF